jgi:hypothetical protein
MNLFAISITTIWISLPIVYNYLSKLNTKWLNISILDDEYIIIYIYPKKKFHELTVYFHNEKQIISHKFDEIMKKHIEVNKTLNNFGLTPKKNINCGYTNVPPGDTITITAKDINGKIIYSEDYTRPVIF